MMTIVCDLSANILLIDRIWEKTLVIKRDYDDNVYLLIFFCYLFLIFIRLYMRAHIIDTVWHLCQLEVLFLDSSSPSQYGQIRTLGFTYVRSKWKIILRYNFCIRHEFSFLDERQCMCTCLFYFLFQSIYYLRSAITR